MPLWQGPAVFALNPATGDTLEDVYCGLGHRTDKGTAHTYLNFYQEMLSPWRDKPVRIVEIGVGEGGDLDLWDRYFTHPDTRIIGVDHAAARMTAGRIQTVPVPHNHEAAASLIGPVDLVIDDGSHQPEDQEAAFRVWWPHVKPGGLYVIEDLRDDGAVATLQKCHPFTEVDLQSLKGRDDDRILWARKPAEPALRLIHIGTAVTEDYAPRAEAFFAA
jgi:hypothetical protein